MNSWLNFNRGQPIIPTPVVPEEPATPARPAFDSDCIFPDCAGHEHDTKAILHSLQHIATRLDVIEHNQHREEKIMSEIDDDFTALSTQLADLATDIDRELADLATALAGKLSAEQQAAFTAITDKVTAMKTAIDTADPAAPPAPVA